MTNTASVQGTCPCCFGAFVVKRGVMVLHGYKRPGHGYIIGNCPATHTYKPYEVSCEGTVAMRDLALGALKNAREYLKKLQKGEVVEFQVERERSAVENMPFGQRRRLTHSERYETVILRKGDGQKYHSWDVQEWYFRVLAQREQETARRINHIESDAAFLNQKIVDWKPVDLTEKLKAAAAAEAAKNAMLCPGSGTTDHDRSRMRFAYYKGGHCNHCKKFVTASSTGKLRKHPAGNKEEQIRD